MKLLLTSAGIKNKSIYQALIDLCGKPIDQCNALAITTSSYALKEGSKRAYEFIIGKSETPMCELNWKSLGILELSALPSLNQEDWIEDVKNADVILVNGGDPLYLSYWMKTSGVADLLPCIKAVYVGLSAGSMIMADRIGSDFIGWNKYHLGDETLGFVNFSLFPHLNHPLLPDNNLENAQKWAKEIVHQAFAIDDETAIKVSDDKVEIISEGHWFALNN